MLYGAAEFSRDLDLALLAEPRNLDRLEAALGELEASNIAVPPFEVRHLEAGLAVHFRCQHPDALGLRIDVMTRMRGVAPFDHLWARRTTFDLGEEVLEVLSLPDLVASKKTQRDKDWPMVRRLVEVNYLTHRQDPTPERIEFWLRELRTPELLVEVARTYPDVAHKLAPERPLLDLASSGALASGALGQALRDEEEQQRRADEAYWKPLRERIEKLRHEARRP